LKAPSYFPLKNQILKPGKRKGVDMKFFRLTVVLVLLFVMMGCGTAAKNSEFMQHDTMYKNWDHLKFSWTGWQSPTMDDVENSAGQSWWGKEIKAENVK